MSKVIQFEGKPYTFPADATDDEISQALSGQAEPTTPKFPRIKADMGPMLPHSSSSQPHVAGTPYPLPSSTKQGTGAKGMGDAVSQAESLLPNPKDAARVAGAATGMALGTAAEPGLGTVAGASLGAATGDALYQNLVERPKTSSEAASSIGNAASEGAIQGALPAIAETHAEHPILPMLSKVAQDGINAFRTPTDTLMTRALNPSDIRFQDNFKRGMDELNAYQEKFGTRLKTFDQAEAAARQRGRFNSGTVDQIVKPQETIVYPDSGKIMADYQISAIPEDVRLNDPQQYEKLVTKIRNSHPNDYTFGELNKMRSELAATQSSYYGKDLSGQLTMDAGTRATDIARGSTARRLLYSGLDNYGLGGGEEAARANRRVGATISFQDALAEGKNNAVAARRPTLSMDNLRSKITGGVKPTPEDDLATAMKRWKGLPEDINPSLEKRVTGMVGSQQDLLPNDKQGNLFSGPNSTTIMPSPHFPDMNPEDEYLAIQNQRRVWNSGQSKARAGQMPLQPTVIRPKVGAATPIMGVNQAEGNIVPAGTIFTHKSTLLDGSEAYHYMRPDGTQFETMTEISPDVLKYKPASTTWPPPGLTPPPKRGVPKFGKPPKNS